MGRRRFYARDSHGRFARTAGPKGVYKKKTSTKRKVAYAAGGAAVVAGAAIGGRELYRAGGRKGYEYGRAQGIKTGQPLRGPRGKFLKDEFKRDSSQNPFARGYRPVGKDGRARRAPKLRTASDRYRQWERRQEGVSPRKQGRAAYKASRAAGVRSAKRVESANARRYNRAQRASQVRTNVGNRARRSAASAVVNTGVAAAMAGQKASSVRNRRRRR